MIDAFLFVGAHWSRDHRDSACSRCVKYRAFSLQAKTLKESPLVRETLSEDLIERFIVDILTITESLQGTGNLFITGENTL